MDYKKPIKQDVSAKPLRWCGAAVGGDKWNYRDSG